MYVQVFVNKFRVIEASSIKKALIQLRLALNKSPTDPECQVFEASLHILNDCI